MKSFFLILFLFFHIQGASHAEEIRITNGEWEPYLSQYSFKYGFASHIVSEAFKLVGIKVKWSFFPWARSLSNARHGEDWDATAVWWPEKIYEKDFWFSDPVAVTSNVFFHLKHPIDFNGNRLKKFHWNNFEDLKSYRIGITRGYHYGEHFNDLLKKKALNITVLNSDEQVYRMILAGRLDAMPNDPIVGASQIRNNFSVHEARKFQTHPKEFAKRTLNLLISKRGKKGKYFLKKFNKGLKLLKEKGKFREIMEDAKRGKYKKTNKSVH